MNGMLSLISRVLVSKEWWTNLLQTIWCSTRIWEKTRCYQVNDGGLNPTNDQTFRRYTLTKSFQRFQNGPVSPSSTNIACVESTERLSQYFSARPEYHLVANWWQVWSEIVAPWLWVVLFSQFCKCAFELKARIVAQVKPIFSQNRLAGTTKCTSHSEVIGWFLPINRSKRSSHSPHPHGVWPLASLPTMAAIPKTSQIQLP